MTPRSFPAPRAGCNGASPQSATQGRPLHTLRAWGETRVPHETGRPAPNQAPQSATWVLGTSRHAWREGGSRKQHDRSAGHAHANVRPGR